MVAKTSNPGIPGNNTNECEGSDNGRVARVPGWVGQDNQVDFQSPNTLVVRCDRQGNIIFSNPAFCQLAGESVDALVGSPYFHLVHPDDVAIVAEGMNGLLNTCEPLRLEHRAKTPHGWRWLSWEGEVYQGGENCEFTLQGIGIDITEQKRAEELAILLAKSGTFAASLPVCLDLALHISGMDSGGIYLVSRQTGDLDLKEHRGLSEKFVDTARHYLKGSDRHAFIMKGKPVYQHYIQTQVNKNPVQINEGLRSFASIPILFNTQVIGCINMASHTKDEILGTRRTELEKLALDLGNMIARVQMQEELAESQHQLQSMFDSLMDYVFVIDKDGSILQVNEMVLKTLGYRSEELIGRSVLEVHPPEERELAARIISEMAAGGLDTCPLDLLKKDGTTIPVETKVAPGRWGNQDVLIGVSRDISERKAADYLLQEKMKEIEGFFTVSLDLLCISDLQGNIIRANDAWEAALGFPVADLHHKNLVDFVHPDDLTLTIKEIDRLHSGQTTLNFENRYRDVDGHWHYLEWRSQLRGGLIYSAIRDITERKAAENIRQQQTDLLAYRNRFEEILTSVSTNFINMPSSEINDGINQTLKQIGELEGVDRCYIFLMDEQKGEMSNTHEWCAPGILPEIDNLQGLSISMFPWWIGKLQRLEEVYIPVVADLPVEARAERDILTAQGIQSVLVVPVVMNKKMVGFLGFDSVTSRRVWSADSILLVRMVGNILSNTLMRYEAESNLLQSEARNSALLGAIPDLILRIRRDGVLLDYKVSDADLLALPPDKVIGSTVQDLLDEKAGKKVLASITDALKSKKVQTLEYSLMIGDGSRMFEARFKDSDTDEVIAIIRDISERVRLEQLKSDFINRATHELRTPIATMLLMVNLIDGETTLDEFNEYWGVMKSELNRERLLVEGLLTAGRLESDRSSLNKRPVDIEQVIRESFDILNPNAREKEINLLLETGLQEGETPITVLGDETALSQVIVNLIGNAIKFTPPGGSVKVRTILEGDGIKISVADTGIGIPAEDLPLLFGRFFRGSNAIEKEIQGTGIGLFIVRSIVEKHDGTVHVTSELGSGSTFEVWLPSKA
jgi:PAS domain S-box-containing protein